MPPIEIAAFGEQHIGARRRQPFDAFEILRRQPDAIVDTFESVLIVAAAAAMPVQQPASYIGVESHGRRFVVFKLIEAAASAAIAKAFPFRIGHFVQWLAPPKWNLVGAVGITYHGVLRAP